MPSLKTFFLTGRKLRNNSFGALRLFASLLIVFTHSFPIALGSAFHEPLWSLFSGRVWSERI